MPSPPLLGHCGCDCAPASCDTKVLLAVIPPANSPDDTGSYCPGVYACPDGNCTTQCSAVENMVAWLLNQWTAFQNNTASSFGGYAAPFTGYAWNTLTIASFPNAGATDPTSITGPTSGVADYGDTLGSGYSANGAYVALNGPFGTEVCASAQLVAMNMTGNLFLTPEDVSGVTESCLMSPSGPYYIPLPPYDLCSEEYSTLPIFSFTVAYVPYQTANSTDCLPGYAGGAYTTCQTPDPFFGDDPP